MRLSEIKQSFIKYLLQHNAGNKRLEEEAADTDTFSLFDHASEFKKYLKTQGKSKLSKYTTDLKDIDKVAIKILNAVSANEEEIDTSTEKSKEEQSETDDLYTELFSNENMVAIFDSDGDSLLSQDEITSALTNIGAIDGNKDDITLDDFVGLSDYINNFQAINSDLEGDEFKVALLDSIKSLDGDSENLTTEDFAMINNIETQLELQNYEEMDAEGGIDQTSGQKLSSPNTHASNYKGPDGGLKSVELTSDVVKTDNDIAALEKQIIEENKNKAIAESASSEYFKENKYTEKLDSLNNIIDNISNYNSTITSLKTDLHTIGYNLTAAQTELDNLADPAVFTEYQDDIDELRGQLRSQIEDLKQQQSEKEEKLKEAEANLAEAETARDGLEAEIKTIEENNPDEKAKQIIQECNQKIDELKKQVEQLKSQKQTQEKELSSKREQEISDAEVFGAAQAYRQSEFVKFMMDYASDPKTKEKYDKWYYEKMNGGAYCAVFTSEVTEIMYAAVLDKLGINPETMNTYGDQNSKTQGLTGNQMSMSAAPWGEKIQPALDALGLNAKGTIDVTGMSDAEKADLVRSGKVYPGMTWEYKHYENGKLVYHTGFVESINQDLSWNTIEGNTAVKYDDGTSEIHTVGSHKRDGFKPYLSSFTDSTLKALIWAYQAGKISEEEMKNMTYSAYYNKRN